MLGVRRFQQRVDNQLVTLFGLPVDGGPKSPGHYYVASAGDVDADGWAFALSSAPSQRVRGSIDYSVDARALDVARRHGGDRRLGAGGDPAADRGRARPDDVARDRHAADRDAGVRPLQGQQRLRARRRSDAARPLDYRFDVQVNQALPFMPFSGTARWEVLVGLRNLFRDPSDAGSIYDELLVVRPPKRVIGGVLVRF